MIQFPSGFLVLDYRILDPRERLFCLGINHRFGNHCHSVFGVECFCFGFALHQPKESERKKGKCHEIICTSKHLICIKMSKNLCTLRFIFCISTEWHFLFLYLFHVVSVFFSIEPTEHQIWIIIFIYCVVLKLVLCVYRNYAFNFRFFFLVPLFIHLVGMRDANYIQCEYIRYLYIFSHSRLRSHAASNKYKRAKLRAGPCGPISRVYIAHAHSIHSFKHIQARVCSRCRLVIAF